MVAAAAGVSPSTVSRVYSHPHRLRPETVERVKRVADELGYVPHYPAQALITGRLGAIGVVVPDVANPFFPPVIRAVQARAHEQGVSTLLADTDEDPDSELSLLALLQQRTDGVVVVSSRLPEEMVIARSRAHPLVLVNRDVPGVPRVLIDTTVGMRDAVDHLSGLGHRSIAYLAGPDTSWSSSERQRAVIEQAARRGMSVSVLGPHRPEHAEGVSAAPAVLALGVTGVIAFDDVLAQGLLAGLIEAGVKVPQDMSLVGCDDITAVRTVPPLTTIRGPSAAAGRAAVDMLLARIDDATEARDEVVRVPGPLVLRATTGSAPRS